jgi:hypothetical protein
MFKRYWLFWGVTQCKLVVNVTSHKTGYIICTAVETLNLKIIFNFRKQRRMYRCIRKIVDLQSVKKWPYFIDCLEAWEPQTPGTIRACPGAKLSYLSAP